MSLLDDYSSGLCQITYLKDGTLLIQAPYDADFVHALKKFPKHCRTWDDKDLTWLITEYTEEAVQLCYEHFEFIEEEYEE